MKKIALLAVLLSLAARAELTIPNVFSPGTNIQSSQVNANFSAVADEINSLESATNPYNVNLSQVLTAGNSCGGTGINFNGNQATDIAIENVTVNPAAGLPGRIWFNTATGLFMGDNGFTDVSLGGASSYSWATVLSAGNSAGTYNPDVNENQLLHARAENLSANPSSGNAGRVFFNTTTHTLDVDTGSAIQQVSGGLAAVLGVSNSAGSSAINFNQQQATALVLDEKASDPGSPATGQVWFNTTSGLAKVYNGTSSVAIGNTNTLAQTLANGNSAGTSPIDFNSQQAQHMVVFNNNGSPGTGTGGYLWYDTGTLSLNYETSGANHQVCSIDQSQTLTGKSISGSSNTLTNIQDASLSSNVALLAGSQSFTGTKTFTAAPVLGTIKDTSGDTIIVPTGTGGDTLAYLNAAQQLNGKTLQAPVVLGNANFSDGQALSFRAENVSSLPTPGNPGRIVWNVGGQTLAVDSGSTWYSSAAALPTWSSVLANGSSAGTYSPNFNFNQALEMEMENLSAAPSAGYAGRIFFNTTLGIPEFDTGSAIDQFVTSANGVVSVPQGGTGDTTLTTNGILYGNGTSAVGATAAGTQYQVYQAGASGVPTAGAVNLAQSAAVTGVLPNANTTATSANAASTIVARDASGNFSAGTITASLTGAASLDCALTGCTMSGAIAGTGGSAAATAFNFGTAGTGLYGTSTTISAATAGTVDLTLSTNLIKMFDDTSTTHSLIFDNTASNQFSIYASTGNQNGDIGITTATAAGRGIDWMVLSGGSDGGTAYYPMQFSTSSGDGNYTTLAQLKPNNDAALGGAPWVGINNPSATVGTLTGMFTTGSSTNPMGWWGMRANVQTSGSEQGTFAVFTQNSGTLTEALNVGPTGVLTLNEYGAGALSSSASGVVSAGTLSVANGGSGAATFTAHGVLLGETTSAFNATSAGTSGQPLLSGGASANPNWGTLGVNYGGTGDTTLTTNGILYGNGTSAVGITAAGTQYQVFQAGASGVPTVGALQLGQSAAVSGTLPGTNMTAVNLAIGTNGGVTGTLPVGNGGTNATSFTAHGVILGESSSALNATSAGTSGQPLLSSGSSSDPNWGTLGVNYGGTGDTTLTAYAILAGGTTSTGALQQVSGVGSSGQVLTSNGASALPTWQAQATAPINYPPVLQYFTASATFNLPYVFVFPSNSLTSGWTYTNNGVTFTVVNTTSSLTYAYLSGSGAPTASGTLTCVSCASTGNITFTAAVAPVALRVTVQGGGAGGCGGGSYSGGGGAGGTNGNNSTFGVGASLITAGGGVACTGGQSNGGAGGTVTVGTGVYGYLGYGNPGGPANGINLNSAFSPGGNGGASPCFGGGGAGGADNSAGSNGPANSGGGGGGAGSQSSASGGISGAGGGSGACANAMLIPGPLSATYQMTIGGTASGGAGGSGFSGLTGGSGAAGAEQVLAQYQ